MSQATFRCVGNKRARKLRQKGVRVWWCPIRESYVWKMTK